MSKNIENSRKNRRDPLQKDGIPALLIFLAVFYLSIGYSVWQEQPRDKLPAELLFSPAPVLEETAIPETSPKGSKVSFPIDINSANEEELTALDGIGPVLAERIVIYRKTRPFQSKEEIMEVYGIGPGIYQKIAGNIIVAGQEETTASSFAPVIIQVIPQESKPAQTSVHIPAVSERPAVTEPLPKETAVVHTTAPPKITTAPKTKTKPAIATTIKAPVPININTASREDFATLPGIDMEMAGKMVYCRAVLGGRFTSIYELLYTEGMTKELFNRIKDYVYVA